MGRVLTVSVDPPVVVGLAACLPCRRIGLPGGDKLQVTVDVLEKGGLRSSFVTPTKTSLDGVSCLR